VRGWNLAALGCAASIVVATAAGCGGSSTTASVASKPAPTPTTTAPANPNQFGEIALTSSAFKNGHPIPAAYTCTGTGGSPPLQWRKVPQEAVELFILTLDLPRNGRTKVLWTVGAVQPGDGQMAAGTVPPGAVVGKNAAGKAGWSGACGAKGERHRVAFLIYALKKKLHLKPGYNPLAVRTQLKAAAISTGLTIASYKHS
jgi:phosphatidylethanolamine-binding protein (PEBP) family uncharacterized protein